MNIKCTHCGQSFEIDRDYIGKTIKCSSCGCDFLVENPNLMPCPDCFASVSRRATTCPHCGAPLKGQPNANALVSASHETANEKLILQCHPSPMYFLWDIVIYGLLSLVLVGIPFLLAAIISIKFTIYEVTSMRVIVKTGWLNKKQTEIWIKDMRGVNMQQSFWDRIIGTGCIAIGTAATAGAEIQMNGISNAQQVIDTINGLRK